MRQALDEEEEDEDEYDTLGDEYERTDQGQTEPPGQSPHGAPDEIDP